MRATRRFAIRIVRLARSICDVLTCAGSGLLAADVIKKESIRGEYRVTDRNKKIAQDVRKVMRESGSTMPENLPVAEPIRVVEKRVKVARKIEAKS